MTGWSCLLCLLPHHRLHTLVSFSVSELQQLVEGHQEPYLLRWDQSRSKCAVFSQLQTHPPGLSLSFLQPLLPKLWTHAGQFGVCLLSSRELEAETESIRIV